MGRYLRGNIDAVQPLATLGPVSLAKLDLSDTVSERTLISSIVATWSLNGWTPVTDAGPIVFGVAHSDYTATEIEEWMETGGMWAEGNKVSQEISRRKIRRIGVLQTPAAAEDSFVFNDGRPQKTKLNWILLGGQTLSTWAYNTGAAAVSGATGADVRANGHVNLFPK